MAKQGFVRTHVGGPIPSVFIPAIGGEATFDAGEGSAPDGFRRADRAKIENLVGTRKNFYADAFEGRNLAIASNEDRLYLCLAAFDAELFARKEKRLLWRTSRSIDQRNDLKTTLPAMLASGAPYFGTDVKKPTFLDDRDRRKFQGEIGESRVVPDHNAAEPNHRDLFPQAEQTAPVEASAPLIPARDQSLIPFARRFRNAGGRRTDLPVRCGTFHRRLTYHSRRKGPAAPFPKNNFR